MLRMVSQDFPHNNRDWGCCWLFASLAQFRLRSAFASSHPLDRIRRQLPIRGYHFQPDEPGFYETYRRGLDLVLARANARDDIPKLLALIAQGRLRPGDVTAQTAAIDDAIEVLSTPLPHKTVLTL